MKKVTVLLVIAFLTLMVSNVTYAQEGHAPEQISTWTLSPNPAAIDATLTTNIDFSFTSADATTRFCIFGPSNAASSDANWLAAMPGSISLRLSQGFTSENVSFAKSDGAATCGDPRSALYTGTYTAGFIAANSIDATTSTGSNVTLAGAGATVGTGNWTLLLEEPTGAPGSIGYSLQLTAAETPYTGLSGRIIDSKNLDPWAYGAEIKVYQSTGTNAGLKGTTYVDVADGTWAVDFGSGGTDDLALCAAAGGCSLGNNNATYVVTVNFKCNLETSVGTRLTISDTSQPVQCPTTGMTAVPVQFEITVTDGATGASFDVGDWETGRGPTAVSLQNVTTDSNTTTAVGIGFVVLMLAGATFVMVRRREVA